MSRRRNRSYGPDKKFILFSKPTAFVESKMIRRIGESSGERMVRERKARHVLDASGGLIGYQLYESALTPEPVVYCSNRRSSSAISRAEAEAVAGAAFSGGKSKTSGLSEFERSKRVASGRAAEDLVETAQNKLAVYRQTH